MVVLVDLEDDALPAYLAPHTSTPSIPDVKPLLHDLLVPTEEKHARTADERPNPNINGFSAALSCYPIVRQLAGQLDLNTLHDLSRTCRQFRANLLEYRDQLIRHTLHCCYEDDDADLQLQARFRERPGGFQSSRHLTSGKVRNHYLGGVGTGAGEGEQGVECGRGPICLGARIVEHETCEAETLEALAAQDRSHNTPESPERWRGTSYLAQEIEGIGGVLKVKHKKYTKVGECVKMYEDEREKSVQWLPRENAGKLRSWCSWCQRVVLGEKDKADSNGLYRVWSSTSSTSSTASK
ncbi:hypothetical protein E8E12_000950 [Didymella heteroderae]|uniref:F-box domain-containing protein n=1 Tax=Didymella heteroderae TaxID=1769908 RepID=A0A9P5BUU7_9PLEO|nr:hypothetical protein E8E12_000950 [Didymella heteroderae]